MLRKKKTDGDLAVKFYSKNFEFFLFYGIYGNFFYKYFIEEIIFFKKRFKKKTDRIYFLNAFNQSTSNIYQNIWIIRKNIIKNFPTFDCIVYSLVVVVPQMKCFWDWTPFVVLRQFSLWNVQKTFKVKNLHSLNI